MWNRRVVMALVALLAAAGRGGNAQPPSPSPSAPASPPAKLFAVVIRTGPAWDPAKPPGEQRLFKEHSQNIGRLKSEGRLAVGGRFSDMGLLLVKAASAQEAQALMDQDPSLAAGTFKAEIHPWSTFAAGCVEPSR
jgi:uncharacterized protein YciI